MGLVDDQNKVNFYDGHVRVVDVEGREIARYAAGRLSAVHQPSASSPWTYLKFPYLKQIGWKGLVDGPESGVYRATPLGTPQCRRGHGHASGSGSL